MDRRIIESRLRAAKVSDEAVHSLLAGWNDQKEEETCQRLRNLGVDRAFIEQNSRTYFGKNVYDQVRPRLQEMLRNAEETRDAQKILVLSSLIKEFDQHEASLREITEATTLLSHINGCPKHGPASTTNTNQERIFEIAEDPRYDREKFLTGLPLAADLKKELLGRGLVEALNRARKWNLSKDGNWTTKQTNDLIYDVVLTPGYELEKFLRDISSL